jgi:pteridine reductase
MRDRIRLLVWYINVSKHMDTIAMANQNNQVALVTGAARRIGAEIVRVLHSQGMNIILHYHGSSEAAEHLAGELNELRADSVIPVRFDLNKIGELDTFSTRVMDCWGRLDVLINNASTFYPTPVEQATLQQWDDLININLKAPMFLSMALCQEIDKQMGSIINIVDIHGDRPLKNHTIYSVAKAGLIMLTRSLARELAPNIRVNGVAPGAIMWPENEESDDIQQQIIDRTALKRKGTPGDIADAAWFLIQSNYITGQVINVDGGRTLSN